MVDFASNDVRPATVLALLAGVVNAALGLWTVSQNGTIGLVGLLWGGIGLTATVAVPLALLARYSLVTPLGTVAVFCYGFYVADATPTVGEPFVGYVLLWPALVAVGVALGGVEYLVRSRLGVAPPGSIAEAD